jgi:hypothetical protein
MKVSITVLAMTILTRLELREYFGMGECIGSDAYAGLTSNLARRSGKQEVFMMF